MNRLHLYDEEGRFDKTLCGSTTSQSRFSGVPTVSLRYRDANPQGKFLGEPLPYCRKCEQIRRQRAASA